ncbi:D-glycero-beta-D-manno-heptose-7-phosphate kinase [Candidatus Pseudothioglobus singularis]|uniref:D-glycero-beta-D-manno-heptose-7-phosphate kinase n=1 Tax=Candidatus Pseudothioglobus singularis TaxID=1427364 RepID=UPI0006B2DAE4|nr:D-glycero-beta-D-manno-heptose-7-phosphate kinase [Candidatus Pseudothioglobus singularis]
MINFKNKTPKILVIGDLMIDQYLWGSCDRISPEAPVQVINVDNESVLLGGAGNVINNLNALKANVDVISVIGECETSTELKGLLAKININTQFLVTQKNRITSRKSRIISAQQQVVRFDRESNEEINEKSQKIILSTFKKIVINYDIVLLSDYGKGVLTPNLTKKLIKVANQNNKKILVDPKGLDFSKYTGAYLLTPNKKEASEATNIIIRDKDSLTDAILHLKNHYKLNVSLITLSEDGVAIYDKNLRIHPTTAREVYDVTGAGDTILASLGFALSCDIDIDQAVQFSNLASGVVVGKIGSAVATLDEIIEYESSLKKSNSREHIKNWSEISVIVNSLRIKERKIIFTNGCFDILHFGHIKYLEKAKSFGDVLILGLNSDASIRKLKGQSRPINPQNDRAYILAALEVVDYVVIFEEETPYELINLIKPDILVKGGDYKGKEVIGKNIAKELKLVEFIEGKSSSDTIKRIQKG